jgi:hypothetical protein
MSRDDIRQEWLQFTADESDRAERSKQSQGALIALFERYRSLTEVDREIVDELLSEQVKSTEERIRFDALAIIGEFKIRGTIPDLRVLADRLERDSGPGSPFEWAKVNRLIGQLTAP